MEQNKDTAVPDDIAKVIARILLTIFICIVSAVAGYFIWYNNGVNKAKKMVFMQQLGTYVLNIRMTRLNGYAKDSLLYKKLTITFKKDSTFHLNFQVPFMYDTVGKWNTGGIFPEDRNHLYFRKWGYEKYKLDEGDYFGRPDSPIPGLCRYGACSPDRVKYDSMFCVSNSTCNPAEVEIDSIYRIFPDSIFCIDNCTPQDGYGYLHEIWFTKISR